MYIYIYVHVHVHVYVYVYVYIVPAQAAAERERGLVCGGLRLFKPVRNVSMDACEVCMFLKCHLHICI